MTKAARYGDYYDNVPESALRLAFVIDAMRFGANDFKAPFFRLTPEQQAQLFDSIVAAVPQMLQNIESFRPLYEAELQKHQVAKERAIREGVVKELPGSRFCAAVETSSNIPRPVQNQVSGRAIIINWRPGKSVEIGGRLEATDGPGGLEDIGDILRGEEGFIHGPRSVKIFTYNPIGLNLRVSNRDLTGLWPRLRQAENAIRTRLGLTPLEDKDSWGGRDAAGGSAKDDATGSVLTLTELATIIDRYMEGK